MNLPEQYTERMKKLLGREYELWLDCFNRPPYQGIRINSRKLGREQWERISPWECRPVLWNASGYYCDASLRPAKHPYYYAGLFYIQEPSAMAPAALLSVKPGDRVLDLCAAPGGKSTDLGARLLGEGLLVANDISASRGKALLKNLEMAGLENICVTSETPARLAEVFPEYFDKILVDAPCSGEGMFRKDPELIKSWLLRGPKEYMDTQREILREAVRMLKPGGDLVYSTCTFSREENEDTVEWLLKKVPEMELTPIPLWEGACGGIGGMPVLRLFPHRIDGEGHFAALLHKKHASPVCLDSPDSEAVLTGKPAILFQDYTDRDSDFSQWERLLKSPLDRTRIKRYKEQLYYLPENFGLPGNLRFLRTGLLLGSIKKGRFEPSQAAAMALKAEDFLSVFLLSGKDERVVRYLKGETIFPDEGEDILKGWVLVCVEDYPLGWAKGATTMIKNKYYPGWRWQ